MVDRLPLERLRFLGGCPQHTFVQRQCDLAVDEYETGVAWLTDTISRIADHPARRVAELLPRNYRLA